MMKMIEEEQVNDPDNIELLKRCPGLYVWAPAASLPVDQAGIEI